MSRRHPNAPTARQLFDHVPQYHPEKVMFGLFADGWYNSNAEMASQVGKWPQSVGFLVYYTTRKDCRKVNAETTDCSQLEREIGWQRLNDDIVVIS